MHREQTVSIILEADVLEVFCRRGRRRLKDIQASCQASLRLDHSRGVLHVRGTLEAISEVHKQLQMLTGPCIPVSAAVWAELMRTRTNPNTSEASIARIQHLTGCRIHIERTVLQVQLLGPQDRVMIAHHLVDALQSMCIEDKVQVEYASFLDAAMLETFAEEFGVTLKVDEKEITIMGIASAVVEAVQELREYAQVGIPQGASGRVSDIVHGNIKAALSTLNVDGATRLPPDVRNPSDYTRQGAVLQKLPLTVSELSAIQQPSMEFYGAGTPTSFNGSCPTCGCSGNFCVKCGASTKETLHCAGAGCLTCGITNFCMSCGHPTQASGGGTMVMEYPSAAPVAQVAQIAPANHAYNPQDPNLDKMSMIPCMQVPMQYAASMMQMPEGGMGQMMMCVPYMMPVTFASFE